MKNSEVFSLFFHAISFFAKEDEKENGVQFIPLSSPAHFLKRNRRMKGARKGVHFTAGFVHEKMEKRRNEEGEDEKRRMVSFYILSVSLVKKEEKKEKNGGIRVFSSLFCSFLGKWRRKRRGKKG